MAAGASDGWRMNRCPLAVLPVLLHRNLGPCSVSGLFSGQCTDDLRILRCTGGGSSDAPLLTSIQTRSNLVKVTPMDTPTLYNLHHRFFKCHLGFVGPLVQILLTRPRAPHVIPTGLLFPNPNRRRSSRSRSRAAARSFPL